MEKERKYCEFFEKGKDGFCTSYTGSKDKRFISDCGRYCSVKDTQELMNGDDRIPMKRVHGRLRRK